MKKQISEDIILAMKNKDNISKSTLQLVKASMENLKIAKGRELTKDEEIKIVQKEVKQTKEALADAKKYERSDLVELNEKALKVLEKYMPNQLNEQDIISVCERLGINNEMNMGQAMKLALNELSGKADNSLVSKVVKKLIL